MSQMEDQNPEFGLAQRELGVKALEIYNEIVATRPFIAGDNFSYADIQMAVNLKFLVRLNRLNIENYKNLNEYINQVYSRPSFSV
jgi:glutathione S-transferase